MEVNLKPGLSCCDPYVEVKLGNYKGVTNHFEKKTNPEWKQVFASSKERIQASFLEVLLKDKHLVIDDLIGRVMLELNDIQKRVPPDSPLAPQFYRLENRRGRKPRSRSCLLFGWEIKQTRLSLMLGIQMEQLILDNERRLRNCYADVVEMDSEMFVEMVLVDAAFLTVILVYNSCETLISSSDRLLRKPEKITHIRYDMVLLQSQLPFFILEDLYKLSKLQNIVECKSHLNFNEETAMTVFAYEFLKDFMTPTVPERPPPSKPEHILDLYRSCLIPVDWNPEKHETETTNMPSMKKLYQAGVKILVGCKENMFYIRFNDGILEIPPLFIHDFTELVFRNLLAYELCHCTKPHIFSDYFELMRLLTLSSEDAELLVQNGVIINGLPNAERVTTLFQNITTGNIIDWSQFLYCDVIKDLNEYYKIDWHKWKATLKEKYFKVLEGGRVVTIRFWWASLKV